LGKIYQKINKPFSKKPKGFKFLGPLREANKQCFLKGKLID